MSAVGMPFSRPNQMDIRASPANTRLRNTSRWDGLVWILMPRSSQDSCHQLEDVALLRLLACGLDDQLHRPAVRQEAQAVARALGRGRSRRAGAFAWSGSKCAQVSRYSGLYNGLCGSTVLAPPIPSPKYMIWLISSRVTRERQRTAEADVPEQLAPYLVIGVQVRDRSRGAPPWPSARGRCSDRCAPRSPSGTCSA